MSFSTLCQSSFERRFGQLRKLFDKFDCRVTKHVARKSDGTKERESSISDLILRTAEASRQPGVCYDPVEVPSL